MHARHQIEEHAEDRSRRVATPTRPHLSPPTEAHPVAPLRIAGGLSVSMLAAHEPDQRAAVLDVHGEIDVETAPLLREVLLSVLEHQTGPVILDLSDVSFMDSTGVHVLVDAHQKLSLENRRLAIACREGRQVHRLLAVLGLLETLPVHRSRDSAVFGGDDRLRPAPDSDHSPSKPPALTQNLISRQATAC